jgi:hypothetical protein
VCHSLDALSEDQAAAGPANHVVIELTVCPPIKSSQRKEDHQQTWNLFDIGAALLKAEGTGAGAKGGGTEWSRFASTDDAFTTAVAAAAQIGGDITATVLFKVEERIGRRAAPFYQLGTIVYSMHYSHRGEKGASSHASQGDAFRRGSSVTVGKGAPATVPGSIPWRSAMTSVFYSEDEASEYARMFDPSTAPHLLPRGVNQFKQLMMKDISMLNPTTEYTDILDIVLRMTTFDNGWPMLPACLDSLRARDSVIALLGVTLTECRAAVNLIGLPFHIFVFVLVRSQHAG